MEENDSPWCIRVYKIGNDTPLEHMRGDGELRTFLNQSEIETDSYDKTRFLSVGDIIHAYEGLYKVDSIDLKFYDHKANGTYGSEVHVNIFVSPV